MFCLIYIFIKHNPTNSKIVVKRKHSEFKKQNKIQNKKCKEKNYYLKWVVQIRNTAADGCISSVAELAPVPLFSTGTFRILTPTLYILYNKWFLKSVLWIRNDLFRIRIQLWIFWNPDPGKSSGTMRIRIQPIPSMLLISSPFLYKSFFFS